MCIRDSLDDREAKAQLDQARANLAWAESESARYAELRQKQVVAKSENQRKETDRDINRSELAIAETAVSAIQIGQKAKLNVQSFPDRTFDATVRYIGPSLRSESRTLVVEAIVPNPEHVLKPGLFVTARVALPKADETLLVPSAAILTNSGVSHVFVLGPQRVTERIVALGDRYADAVEVHSGLAAGE